MMEAYDTTYGLFDDRSGKIPPFASQLVHPNEALGVHTGWQLRMREYRAQRVWDLFGLGFTEFMALPRHMIEWILQECELANSEGVNQAESEQTKLERTLAEEKKKAKK
nr:MAG: hypothetical protein [Bacteriophage sp.]